MSTITNQVEKINSGAISFRNWRIVLGSYPTLGYRRLALTVFREYGCIAFTRGLACRGKAAKDVDIVSLGYRYAVVWPSEHPDGGIYQWYKNCKNPDGQPLGLDGIPNPMELPILPDAWVDYITVGRMPFHIDEIDMEFQGSAAIDWATENFPEINNMCYRMKQKLGLHKRKIKADPSSHDKMINAHWNMTRLAAEGHYGWGVAIQDINQFYADDVEDREKRGRSELQGEIRRSITNAVRKIKLQIEDAGGIPPNDPECVCVGLRDVDKYDTTHRGNGEHFKDLKEIDGEPTIYYVSDWKKWIVWDKETNRWLIDEENGGLIRRQWFDVEDRQKEFVASLKADYDTEVENATNSGFPARGSAAAVPDSLIKARNKWDKWSKFVLKSGDNYHAEASIRAAANQGLTIDSKKLNWNKNLIACTNGVLEIDQKNKRVNFREQDLDDLITMNTGIEWHENPNPESTRMWNCFVDTFIPDAAIQRMAQMAIGHTLLEGNQERVFIICLGQTSTGKSTAVRLWGKAMGDYGAPVGKTFFQGQHKFKPSLILNARKTMVYTTEFDGNTVISTAVVKEYTGGDSTETERKGVDAVSKDELNFVPILATNLMPSLSEPDMALFRRLYILPFDEIISQDDEDKKFGLRLEKEFLDAVLHWIIDGLILYMQNGEHLIRNKFTEALVNDAVIEMGDWASEFIDACLEKHEHHDNYKIDKAIWTQQRPEWTINNPTMWQHLQAWMFSVGYQAKDIPTENMMTRRFRALGMRKEKDNVWVNGRSGKYWLGVRFRPGAQIFTIQPGAFQTKAKNN